MDLPCKLQVGEPILGKHPQGDPPKDILQKFGHC